jgi:hypothetical protein
MKHLSNDDLLTAIDGETTHATHLSTCAPCLHRVEELREVLRLAGEVDVPEPSPLFWDHLSRRVRAAVAAEPLPEAPLWRSGLSWMAGTVGALAIIVIGVAVTLRTAQPVERMVPPAAIAESVILSLDDDAAWALIGDMASQMEWDEATEAGLIATPGSAEHALGQMSQEEQARVVELLQQELQKSKIL